MIKIILFSFLFIMFTHLLFGQTYGQNLYTADSLAKLENFKLATKFYEKALNSKAVDKDIYYNAACIAAKAGNKDLAFQWLNRSIERNFNNLKLLTTDEDLKALHSDPKWNKSIELLKTKQKHLSSLYNPKTEKALAEIFNKDQGIRKEYLAYVRESPQNISKLDSLGKVMMSTDSINAIEISKILKDVKTQDIQAFSDHAITTIFSVIQHSNISFQEKYSPFLKQALNNGQIKEKLYVMLLDRMEMAKGNDQMYGTQILTTKENYSFVSPVYDPINLDKRRLEVGLPKMQDYLNRYNLKWNPTEHIAEKAHLKKLQIAINVPEQKK